MAVARLTIRSFLNKNGLKCQREKKKTFLQQQHKTGQLRSAKQNQRLESKLLQQKWFSSDETKAELYGRTRQGCFFFFFWRGVKRAYEEKQAIAAVKLGAGHSGSSVGTEDKPNAAFTGGYQRTVSVTRLTHGDDDGKHKAKSALQRLQAETREGYGGAPSQPPEPTQTLWQYR